MLAGCGLPRDRRHGRRRLAGGRRRSGGRSGLAEDLPQLHADERRVRQIILNLLSNAIKFTPSGGDVEITAEQDTDGDIVITVRDTGPGIPEDQFGAIFQAYRQLDNTASGSKVKGTGLGLAITRHLVQAMGGEIRLESHLAKGTTFTIVLPLHPVVVENQLLVRHTLE